MTSDVKLLPLPKWMERFVIPGDAHGDQTLSDRMTAYARDNMEPLIAEIEAARAEREVICAEAVKYADKSGRLEARAERLAKQIDKAKEPQ